ESAGALAALGGDPAELVTACRRLLERHAGAGALWTLAARMCVAPDAAAAARSLVSEMRADATADVVVAALPRDAVVCVLGRTALDRTALTVARLDARDDLEVRVLDACGEGAGLAAVPARAGVAAVDVPPA
ncbi:MAG TPA: hypothetical protein DEP69_00430, partial [Acidimicrobiaceae bacterium]|nr:hypothetical protein [Acidimicrobiaceae bacterium]